MSFALYRCPGNVLLPDPARFSAVRPRGDFQKAETGIQSNIAVSVAGVGIIQFAVCVRIERQTEQINLVLENIDDAQILLHGKIPDRALPNFSFRAFFIHFRNPEQLGKGKIGAVEIFCKDGQKHFAFGPHMCFSALAFAATAVFLAAFQMVSAMAVTSSILNAPSLF